MFDMMPMLPGESVARERKISSSSGSSSEGSFLAHLRAISRPSPRSFQKKFKLCDEYDQLAILNLLYPDGIPDDYERRLYKDYRRTSRGIVDAISDIFKNPSERGSSSDSSC